MNLADLPDEELVALVRDQQDSARTAFGELVRRHEADLLRLFRGFHPRRDDVSDLAQDLWVRLWRSLSDSASVARFDPSRGSFQLFLFHMARNAAIDWYRRSVRDSSRRGELPPSSGEEEAADPPAGDAFGDVIFNDLLDAVERRLDDRERLVFRLLRRGLSIGQICELTGLSQPSVWRIQQKLKKAISEVIGS